MLHAAVVFFAIALGALLLGFGGIAAGALGVAKILFVLFAMLTIVGFAFGLLRAPTSTVPVPDSPRSTTT